MTAVREFAQTPIQEIKAFWNSHSPGLRHSGQSFATREYFDEIEARRYFVEPHIPRFAEFERWKGKKVLEIGCGLGSDTVNFARHGAQVTAVDLSENSIQAARQRARIYGVEEGIRFLCGDAEELGRCLSGESFDLIYSFGVIHHTPHPERILQQIRGLVHPESTLKLMVYHRFSWKVLWILLKFGGGQFWRLGKLVARYSESQKGCPVTYTYTRSEARRLLERNGFQVSEIQADHIFPYRIPDYIQHRYVKVWYFRWMPSFLFDWLKARFGWHLLITARPAPGRFSQ